MNDTLEPIPSGAPDGEDGHDGPRINDHFIGRLVDLVVKPSRLMENVGAAPRWWPSPTLGSRSQSRSRAPPRRRAAPM